MKTKSKELLDQIKFPTAGKYILAVSGGVDSICLLDILAKASKYRKYELIVAHYDHGMRPDSAKDSQFVKQVSSKYGLQFVSKQGKLGPKATEAQARDARYHWLRAINKRFRADGIITAHHQDDALETAIFNAGRGSDRWGLTSLHLSTEVLRPLLGATKTELVSYAKAKKLVWQKDPSYQNLALARNFIRHRVMPLLNKARLAKEIAELANSNQRDLNLLLQTFNKLAKPSNRKITFRRYDLIMLNDAQRKDLLSLAASRLGGALDSHQLEKLSRFAKTAGQAKMELSAKLRAVTDYDILTLFKHGSAA